jgi:hypothetical protein
MEDQVGVVPLGQGEQVEQEDSQVLQQVHLHGDVLAQTPNLLQLQTVLLL